MGGDDFSGYTCWLRIAVLVDNFDNDIFGCNVQAALGAFVGDEAGVAPAVTVGNRAAKCAFNRFALIVVKSLRCTKYDADARLVERNALL